MKELPDKSSGARWSPEEDQRLYDAVKALTAQFTGRSLAAVVTRIALISPQWSKGVDAVKRRLGCANLHKSE